MLPQMDVRDEDKRLTCIVHLNQIFKLLVMAYLFISSFSFNHPSLL